MNDEVVSADARGRVSLGRILPEGVTQFLAHREPDGTVVLEPAVTISLAEARLHANPELHAELVAAAQPGAERMQIDLAEQRRRRQRRARAANDREGG